MAEGETRFRVWRGDAAGGAYAEYRLSAAPGMVVLDALQAIQSEQAGDLALRWNCKAGRCGSCSAEINGRPSLMCMTRLDALPSDEPVTVAPMRAFPVIRDLVTDVSENYAKAAKIPAFSPLQFRQGEHEGAARTPSYVMCQEDVDRIREFHKCIECFLCQDTCHVIRDHVELRPAYSGPRFFVRLAALEMHPLDAADRMPAVEKKAGIGLCNVTRCCTEVCPEGIRITDNAIIPLKERVADRSYDPPAKLFGWFSNRRT